MTGRVFIADDRCAVSRAAAAHLASLGYTVQLNRLGGEAVPGCDSVRFDLTDVAALTVFFDIGAPLCGVIFGAPPVIHASIEDADEDSWSRAFEQGVLSALTLTQAACGHMARLGGGAMIYLGSIHAEKPMGYGFLSTMGLSAVQMLCREAAIDYGRRGVNCFYVQRGLMESDMPNDNDITNQYAGLSTRYPFGRPLVPDDLNGLIAFLLTPGAAPFNGADLRADGGSTMYYGLQREDRV